MKHAVKNAPSVCNFLIKVTGKYTPLNLAHVIKTLHNNTLLALSSRGHSYGGYASELFGIERNFLGKALDLWTDKRNTESFLERIRLLVESIDHTRIVTLPRLPLSFNVHRFTDKALIKFV